MMVSTKGRYALRVMRALGNLPDPPYVGEAGRADRWISVQRDAQGSAGWKMRLNASS